MDFPFRIHRPVPTDDSPAMTQPVSARLKIGLSACFSHADPARSLFTNKTLQYVEQSIAHWLMSAGAMQSDGASYTGDLYRTTGPAFNANPFTPLIRSYRNIMLEGRAPDWRGLAYFTGFALLVFIFGYWWFAKTRKNFADVI